MRLSRRNALRLGSSVGLSSLAGCGLPALDAPELTLTLLNWDTREHLLRVQLLRPDRDRYDDAVVHSGEYRLAARGDGGEPGAVEEPALVANRRYLVRASLGGNTGDASSHHHFFPPEASETPDGEPTLYVEVRQDQDGTPRLEIF